MLTYFVTPNVTSTLSGASEWFNPLFDEFFPWALIGIGVVLVFSLLGWIIHLFRGGFHN